MMQKDISHRLVDVLVVSNCLVSTLNKRFEKLVGNRKSVSGGRLKLYMLINYTGDPVWWHKHLIVVTHASAPYFEE